MDIIKSLCLLLLVPLSTNSQPVVVRIKVLQGFSAQAKLFIYNGSQVEPVDSAWQGSPGTYEFTLGPDHEQGLYKVDVGKNISFDLIITDEPEIDVETNVFAPNDSIKSQKSLENQILWEYQKLKKKHEQQTWLIRSLMDYYSDSTILKQLLDAELYKLNLNIYSYSKNLQETHANLFATKLVSLEQRPVPPPEFEGERKKYFQIDNWWDDFQLSDKRLIHSPAFTLKIWGYIELLFNDNFDKEQQDNAFILGVSTLMGKQMDDSMAIFVRNLLIEGFKESDYLNVVDYLEIKSFQGLSPLKEKIIVNEKNKPKVLVGEKAYDFIVDQPNGKQTKLSKLKAKYKLVIFWSSWCPHCLETLPRIADIYKNYSKCGLEIIAISIDEEDNLWQDYINKLDLKWINMRIPFTAKSNVLSMYDVNETPKMFLLSDDLTILSRPATRKQLEVKIKSLIKGDN